MMIFAQKLTYVAFSFHDGIRQTESLTVFQKAYALKFEAFLDEATKPKVLSKLILDHFDCLRNLPSLLEFSSYVFNFQSVIVGPSYLYQDYQDFITGENITKHKVHNFYLNTINS
jgi:hypothetical protein